MWIGSVKFMMRVPTGMVRELLALSTFPLNWSMATPLRPAPVLSSGNRRPTK